MASRDDFQTLLESILGSDEVYFQPPSNIEMSYPAITYTRRFNNSFADNKVYSQAKRYNVIVMDRNADSPIVEAISKLPTCTFITHYASDNINHDVFEITY